MSTTTYPRVPTTLLFNIYNGLFVTAVGRPIEGFLYDRSRYIAREVLFSLKNDTVVGGIRINEDTIADDFKVVPKAEVDVTVYERSLNAFTEREITQKYPLVEQINILTNALVSITEQNAKLQKLEPVQDLLAMVDFIKVQLKHNSDKKKDCESCETVNYVSDDELAALNDKKLQGLVDPSTVTAKTRVFKTD